MRSLNGVALSVFVDSRNEYGDAVFPRVLSVLSLDDSDSGVAAVEHQQRWADWLQWANVLQFANASIAEHVVAVSSERPHIDLGDLSLIPGGSDGSEAESVGVEDVEAELALITDASVLALVRRAIAAGAGVPIIGFDIDDDGDLPPAEAAWPEACVAILVGVDAADTQLMQAEGWEAKDVDDWTLGELLTAIGVEH
jgi:hypothetical protein